MKEKGGETEHVSIRFTSEELARIKRFIPEFSRPWREATLSDVVRLLIRIGFESVDEIVASRRKRRSKAKRKKYSNASSSRQLASLADAAAAPLQKNMRLNDDSE